MAGSSKKEENTMPVELAIQRELEYRRIVAAFHLRPNTNSTEEVKSSNDVSHPKPFPGPSSSKFSSLLGTRRKESPTRSAHHQRLQQQQPISSLSGTKRKESPTRSAHHPHQQPFHGSLNHQAKTDDLCCKICQISCLGPFNLKQHLRGHKHKQKLQMGRSNQTQWCEVCSVLCMNEDLLKLHFQGQKHKAKLQMLEISKQGGEASNKPKWCELCKLWCSDEFAFKQHLEGKKHIIQLHAMEKEKERRP
ncbi:Zinc finger RNA-binding protein [Spatholobus suberectus]|nr:Zinc finger RNA-binding protein [Spatholobus suberectus]